MPAVAEIVYRLWERHKAGTYRGVWGDGEVDAREGTWAGTRPAPTVAAADLGAARWAAGNHGCIDPTLGAGSNCWEALRGKPPA